MSRADLVFWDVAMNMPITMDGVSDGMWAIILITAIVFILAHDASKTHRSYPPYDGNRRPPMYPPW